MGKPARLQTLDPALEALAPMGLAALQQDSQATAQVVDYSESRYRIHYRAATETLLRVSAAFFPGWTAHVDGRPREVYPADHALIGVAVPPGEDDLILEYHSNYFAAGAIASLIALLACAAILAKESRIRNTLAPPRAV